ncbi:hypothetical protein BC938DRAFT_481939 [Jimgerdemannia flammicorona]|uniref:Uncharacterized protein n=1 Tax=Jimgerdemannia flammicorona TaxID=994334 RepID=A0A433QEZ4_9FUNG|nr:hypothetical protein BC938DRAFT_481939 [Jimgerdemannia flammicorona]
MRQTAGPARRVRSNESNERVWAEDSEKREAANNSWVLETDDRVGVTQPPTTQPNPFIRNLGARRRLARIRLKHPHPGVWIQAGDDSLAG